MAMPCASTIRSLVFLASATNIQSNFFVVNAPYASVMADVLVALGDMAMHVRKRLDRCRGNVQRVCMFPHRP